MHEVFRDLELTVTEDDKEKLLDDSGENSTADKTELGFLSSLFQSVWFCGYGEISVADSHRVTWVITVCTCFSSLFSWKGCCITYSLESIYKAVTKRTKVNISFFLLITWEFLVNRYNRLKTSLHFVFLWNAFLVWFPDCSPSSHASLLISFRGSSLSPWPLNVWSCRVQTPLIELHGCK